VTDAAIVRARPRWSVSAISTPSGLKVAIVVTVVAIGVFGIVGWRAATDRGTAAEDVVDRAAPLLLDAQDLYVILADADAAASTIFLQAGFEPPALRQRYNDDLGRAGERLAAIAAADLGPDARAAVETLAEELPAYTGFVETARANSRQGFPVGAAYLRRASELMRVTILPAATTIYEDSVLQLDDRYRAGTGRSGPSLVAVTAGLAVLAIVATQLYVTWRSRRWLNAGLVVAAALVVVAAALTSLALRAQAGALADSRENGAELVTALSTSRILMLRSLSDENLDLIERGTEEQFREDFDLRVGDASALLERALGSTEGRRALGSLEAGFGAYLAAHDEVRRLSSENYREAVELAVTDEASAARLIDDELAALIDGAATALDQDADRASDLAVAFPALVVLAAIVAAVAVVVGMQPRLREYR
jgi:hypothetical protein